MDLKNIINALRWRYAVKKFDLNKKISAADLQAILESGRLAPSSFGLEPWKFIVIDNLEIRARLREASFNQPQLTDAAKLVVIASRTDIVENITPELLERTAKIQNKEISSLGGLKKVVDGFIASKETAGTLEGWVSAQAYISLGMMMETASLLGIDTSPIEGFSVSKVGEILGLPEKSLRAVVMLALGYRGEDEAALRPKVRREFKEVVEFIV